MKRLRLWIGLLLLLCLAAALWTLLDPNRRVRGLLAGEAFHKGRPTSYWRRILHEDGACGSISAETRWEFQFNHDGVDVLLECARDEDSLVRWPAIGLLRLCDCRQQRVLDTLLNALGDEDPEVRLKAMTALAVWGPMANSAIPPLISMLQDKDAQIAHWAEHALWHIDKTAATNATGWQPFSSVDWRFSVRFPGQPEHKQQHWLDDDSIVIHSYSALHDAVIYTVAVSEHPAAWVEAIPEDERLDPQRHAPVTALGGEVLNDLSVDIQGHKGRERLIEVENVGLMRTRLFWIGRRFYQVYVTSNRQFWNPFASDYFLDSFRFEAAAGKEGE